MKTSALSFAVASDLYVAGRSCDGHEFTAERFYVLATDAAGNRWSVGSFAGALAETDEEGYTHFGDVRVEARAAAERLLSRIHAAGNVDLSKWREERPVYGSDAYLEYGQSEDLAWERSLG